MVRSSFDSGRVRFTVLLLGGVLLLTLASCWRQEAGTGTSDSGGRTTEAAGSDTPADVHGPPRVRGSQLSYDTPEGWLEDQVDGAQKAAFHVEDGDRKVEITVTEMAYSADDLLSSVNQWRRQLELEEVTHDDLAQSMRLVDVLGVRGAYVELAGSEDSQPRRAILGIVATMGRRTWVFKLSGDEELALREKQRFRDFAQAVKIENSLAGDVLAAHGAGPLTPHGGNPLLPHGGEPFPPGDTRGGTRIDFIAPEGWKPAPVGGIRKAAFSVEDGEQSVEITAMDLPSGSARLLLNVNRWRKQIQLGEITQEELDKTVRPIQIADVAGQYVELLGPEDSQPRQAILAVMAVRPEGVWFFKLMGPVDLALREKERFQAFVKSVTFTTSEGVDLGSSNEGAPR